MDGRVLVVDDDADIREMLASTLGFSGFTVETAPDGPTALTMLAGRRFDAAVLDVMMPGVDGFELVQLLRRRDRALPVLFLSARDAVDDRVRGLRLGADDYLTKPFSAVEVTARLEALIRRAGLGDDGDAPLRCGDLELDVGTHRVERGGEPIALSPTEFRMLELLLEHRGQVLSKQQLLETIWRYDFGGDTNVVERFISNLRRKIDDGRTPLIRTVRGFGYAIDAQGPDR